VVPDTSPIKRRLAVSGVGAHVEKKRKKKKKITHVGDVRRRFHKCVLISGGVGGGGLFSPLPGTDDYLYLCRSVNELSAGAIVPRLPRLRQYTSALPTERWS